MNKLPKKEVLSTPRPPPPKKKYTKDRTLEHFLTAYLKLITGVCKLWGLCGPGRCRPVQRNTRQCNAMQYKARCLVFQVQLFQTGVFFLSLLKSSHLLEQQVVCEAHFVEGRIVSISRGVGKNGISRGERLYLIGQFQKIQKGAKRGGGHFKNSFHRGHEYFLDLHLNHFLSDPWYTKQCTKQNTLIIFLFPKVFFVKCFFKFNFNYYFRNRELCFQV